jgi:cell division transport system permease protein
MRNHWMTTFIHIRRSPYQATAAILVMLLTFFVVAVFGLLGRGSEVVMRYFETRPQVIAFLKDDVSADSVDALRATLVQSGKVKDTKYVSKSQALEIYREQNKNDPLLLEMVTSDILPASLEVSATSISNLNDIAQTLKNTPGVDEVIFQEDIANSIQNITVSLRKIGIVLISFFCLVSLLVVTIVVGMKAAAHREEIEILRLLGASTWYVRWPFIMEGVFYGFSGAIIGWGVSYITLLYSTPFLVRFLSGISVLPFPVIFMLELLGGEILAGTIIGFCASFLAVKRYLK